MTLIELVAGSRPIKLLPISRTDDRAVTALTRAKNMHIIVYLLLDVNIKFLFAVLIMNNIQLSGRIPFRHMIFVRKHDGIED